MSSLGRLTAALGVAHNENTLTLANVNFDFSLFKVEAPQEFHGLGANLSNYRRQEAESGTPHRIARKLGALFEGVFPRTPELTRAYGRRVSQISQSRTYNPKGTGEDGPFAAHTGADGTAIWAAATSGPSAIPILMLTCMLARLWPGPEATSLWVEIVAFRRQEIETSLTGQEARDFVLLQAAKQDFPRSHLAEWDASARAWLQTADQAKKLEQTQLMLIINNLQLPVSNNMSVYQSVIESTRLALSSMESLLGGMSQRVQSGAVLLGLSAWHLYPDMIVHGNVTREIIQKDDLIPLGSLITLGLQSDVEWESGVFWSLPLAHLRYYGDPIQSSRSTGHDASRISIDNLVDLGLGALLTNWVARCQDIGMGLKWFCKLSKNINTAAVETEESSSSSKSIRKLLRCSSWVKMLIVAAVSHHELADREKELSAKLMALGHRRYNTFLAEGNYRLEPYFGLLNPVVLFPLLKKDEDRLSFLRTVAANLALGEKGLIIRYKHCTSRTISMIRIHNGQEQSYTSSEEVATYEFASAFPSSRSSAKRVISGQAISNQFHKRWIAMTWDEKSMDLLDVLRSKSQSSCRCKNGCGSTCKCNLLEDGCFEECLCQVQGLQCTTNETSLCTKDIELVERAAEIQALGEECSKTRPRSFLERFRQMVQKKNPSPEEYGNELEEISQNYQDIWMSDQTFHTIDLEDAPWDDQRPIGPNHVRLEFLYGDMGSAALYRIPTQVARVPTDNRISSEELFGLFDEDTVDVLELLEYFASFQDSQYAPCISSLKALAAAMDVYKLLPEATIALNIATKPLHIALWANTDNSSATNRAALNKQNSLERAEECQTHDSKDQWDVRPLNPWKYELSLASTFACIAMFEIGTYNIDPSALEHVFAMSSGNSIFVAAPLLSDPSERSEDYEVRRVVGNIGRAGIAMLIPPQDPRVRKPEPESWHLINHAPYNGQRADSFQNTSLHLSFTQYTMPFNIGDHGAQDTEAFFIESLISVHDRDKWVADLDVLGVFRSPNFKQLVVPKACQKDHSHDQDLATTSRLVSIDEGLATTAGLVSIDNWEELLDREDVSVVVRASRNPVARLAAAGVSVQQGYQTVTVPESAEACWLCAMQWQGNTTYIY